MQKTSLTTRIYFSCLFFLSKFTASVVHGESQGYEKKPIIKGTVAFFALAMTLFQSRQMQKTINVQCC